MINKLEDDEKLCKLLFSLLFEGQNISYNPYEASIQKGYMLSFNFNKKKEIGVKEVVLGDKLLIEAVV